MEVPEYLLPLMVAGAIRDFYSDCSTMEDATYNLGELVGHMAHGRVYWDANREPFNSDAIHWSQVSHDVDTMNFALSKFYNNTIEPNLMYVGEMTKINLDERRGVLSIIYE